MPPGPKRKGKKDLARGKAKQSDACDVSYNNQLNNASVPSQDASGEAEVTSVSEDTTTDGKYSKRRIQSNWERYEERSPGLYEDTMRGDSFEVLSSYQGGADSYLKLKEEKDWSSDIDLQKGLYVDCEKLASSLKAIPFHERLHLPVNCFTPGMIKTFKEAAAKNRPVKPDSSAAVSLVNNEKSAQYPPPSYKPNELRGKETVRSDPEKVDSSQAASYTKEKTSLLCPSTFEVPDVRSKQKEVTKETESIILSLTQSLSLKDDSQKVADAAAAAAASASLPLNLKSEDEPKVVSQDDDLAELLSLSGLQKQPDVKEQQSSSTSIEDWLNELLNK